MKLATLRNGTRDGRLVVVSRDLTQYTDASFLVPTLQAALDNWQRIVPHLLALAESLEHGSVPSARFHEHDALAPLPRAYQRYVVENGRAEAVAAGPLGAARGSTSFPGRVQASVAAILDDADGLAGSSRLFVLLCDIAVETGDGGSVTLISPVAVTADELAVMGAASLLIEVNGRQAWKASLAFAGLGEGLGAALTGRQIAAGTIAGPVSVVGNGATGPGDTIRIAVADGRSHSVFGAIERPAGPSPALA